MTPQPRRPSPSRVRLALCLVQILVFTGCAAMQLDTFRKRSAAGDHEWIAAQTVTCQTDSDLCGRLHLIKGDACLRLARAGTAPAANYACAAEELARGLALNRSWADAAVHRQLQENLCESLNNLLDLQPAQATSQTLSRYLKAAQGLYQLAPESVPAVYYLASARLRRVRPLLFNLNAADRVPVCSRLKRTVTRVLAMTQAAEADHLPDWERFAARYQRLIFDLGSAMHTAGCR